MRLSNIRLLVPPFRIQIHRLSVHCSPCRDRTSATLLATIRNPFGSLPRLDQIAAETSNRLAINSTSVLDEQSAVGQPVHMPATLTSHHLNDRYNPS